ncbi:MAG: hypothetical protein JWR69_870, partial [Pedosphaera sp.]|nr:hypothetical protein [Pedosphaera sp.]
SVFREKGVHWLGRMGAEAGLGCIAGRRNSGLLGSIGAGRVSSTPMSVPQRTGILGQIATFAQDAGRKERGRVAIANRGGVEFRDELRRFERSRAPELPEGERVRAESRRPGGGSRGVLGGNDTFSQRRRWRPPPAARLPPVLDHLFLRFHSAAEFWDRLAHPRATQGARAAPRFWRATLLRHFGRVRTEAAEGREVGGRAKAPEDRRTPKRRRGSGADCGGHGVELGGWRARGME